MTYPLDAGWKEPTTSREAAESTPAATIREEVWRCIYHAPWGLTADEVAARLNLSVLTVRPRCSELVAQGRILDSGKRRPNASSGKNAKVWICPRGQLSLLEAA